MKNLKLPSLVPSLAVQTLALSGFCASVMFAAKPAQAATFTASINGTDYNITTVTGSYNSLKTQLEATPWWNNQALATSVAKQATPQLGTVREDINNSWGPIFAFTAFRSQWSDVGDIVQGMRNDGVTEWWGRTQQQQLPQWQQGRFAVAAAVPAAVPEPLTILGSITAAGLGVAFKRKRNSKKGE